MLAGNAPRGWIYATLDLSPRGLYGLHYPIPWPYSFSRASAARVSLKDLLPLSAAWSGSELRPRAAFISRKSRLLPGITRMTQDTAWRENPPAVVPLRAIIPICSPKSVFIRSLVPCTARVIVGCQSALLHAARRSIHVPSTRAARWLLPCAWEGCPAVASTLFPQALTSSFFLCFS